MVSGAPILTSWNFGDGTTGSGAALTHTYTQAGVYPVIATINDGVNSAASSLIVTVRATRVGFGVDSDGDGFSDATELATGTNADDPNSNVLGKPLDPASIGILAVTKAQIKLNFAKSNSDSIAIGGVLLSPSQLNVANSKVLVDIGGVSKMLVLNAKGAAKLGNDTLKLTLQKGPSLKFTASFKKGSFGPTLGTSSNLSNDTIPGGVRTIAITVALISGVYEAAQPVTYKAKKFKSGTASN